MNDAPEVITPNQGEFRYQYFGDAGELADDTTQIVQEFKKGYRTTEFWVVAAGAAVIIAGRMFGLDLDPAEVAGLVGLGLPYVLTRMGLKRKRLDAIS